LAAAAFHATRRFGFDDAPWALIGMYTRGTTARTTWQRLKIVLRRLRMPEFGRQCAEYAST
jgi:hypothetical protein